MSRVYVTSDWHLGHKGISNKFRKEFSTDEEHDGVIYDNAHSVLTKRDTLLCLGDMAFTLEGLEMIRALPGRKILVRGNHDEFPLDRYVGVFDDVRGAMSYKGAFLTHIPIHPMELYRGANIHGHCHKGGPFEMLEGECCRSYFNAILEFNDYTPVPMDEVWEILDARVQ